MTAPILVFDSGVGGLSVLGPIRSLLPGLGIVYAADNAGFPYGTRSEAEIAARVPALLGRLVERFRPQLVVIACNTASTIALSHVRAALDVAVVGTVPAVKPAAERSLSRVIGVLGTAATVRQAYVDRLSAEFAGDCLVLRHGSARLVTLAEAKLAGETVTAEDVAPELRGLTDQPGGDRMDMVALACTHFPLLQDELAAAATQPLAFVDGGAGIARRVAHLLGPDAGQRAGQGVPLPGRAVFTRADAHVDALARALQGFGLDSTEIL
ncbi:glutamate racemase [Sandarakinorhabdus sp. DWP1-3-1]|uniref:glutamate racemase n=1 Tax=Sandarakinorhabdus sp. DWP1-3-1 TaxID=2804627 RepID=UPI003CE6FC46